MGTGLWGYDDGEFTDEDFLSAPAARRPANAQIGWPPAHHFAICEQKAKPVSRTHSQDPSVWSGSAAKRIFDCVCAVLALPVLIPILLAVAAAVRFTSRGPVLFLQKRVGRNGRTFTILKFRTMVDVAEGTHHAITTLDNQRFTSVGPFFCVTGSWMSCRSLQICAARADEHGWTAPQDAGTRDLRHPLPARNHRHGDAGIRGRRNNSCSRAKGSTGSSLSRRDFTGETADGCRIR